MMCLFRFLATQLSVLVQCQLFLISIGFPLHAWAGSSAVKHYPCVHIHNPTSFLVFGVVRYAWCSSDYYFVDPRQDWTASSRGLCLVASISAMDTTDRIPGDSYTSSGTSYSHFYIYLNDARRPSVARQE